MSLRLLRFVIASRAQQLSSHVPVDLKSAIKKLSPQEIKKMFKDFVPLDLIALIQEENGAAFSEALESLILAQLNNDQNKKWIAELELTPQDLVQEVYLYMIDPNNNGALAEILDAGSFSRQFNYASKPPEKRKLNTREKNELQQKKVELRNSLTPLNNGIVVPTCPIDSSLGITKYLWTVDASSGSLSIESGLKDGRCSQQESLGPMSPEDFEALRDDYSSLSKDQVKELNENKRTLEYEGGEAFLRCTFKAAFPKFQNFVYFKAVVQAVKSVLDAQRSSLGHTISPADFKRRNELESKEKSDQITREEKIELKRLKEKMQKKEKDYVSKPMSMDAPSSSEEGEKSRHETTRKSVDSVSEEDQDAEDAKFDLSRKLGEDRLERFSTIVQSVSLSNLYNMIKKTTIRMTGAERKSLSEKINTELSNVANNFSSKQSPNYCKTCGTTLETSIAVCPHSEKMRRSLAQSYKHSSSLSEFKSFMDQLDPKSLEHFKQSGVPSKVESIFNKIYSGIEVGEDEIDLGDLDLSGFMDSEEEDKSQQVEKLDEEDFKSTLESKLNEEQKSAYFGTNISSSQQQDSSELKEFLGKFLSDVGNKDLIDELGTYLISLGAQ